MGFFEDQPGSIGDRQRMADLGVHEFPVQGWMDDYRWFLSNTVSFKRNINPIPWGFMIQFDLRIYFSFMGGYVKTHSSDHSSMLETLQAGDWLVES